MIKPEQKHFLWRINAVLLLLVLGAVVLVSRVVLLQLLDVEKGYEFLQEEGAQRSIRVVEFDAPRGAIVDRHGKELAVSTPVVTLGANPVQLLADPKGLEALAYALGRTPEDFKASLLKKAHKKFIYLKRNLSPSEANDLLLIGAYGVRKESGYRRFYPAGETTAHIVGFSDIDDNGQEGVELAFNKYLQPTGGSKRVLRNRYGNTVRELETISEATPGKVLALSIDLRIQYAAYTALASAVKAAEAVSGSMVLADSQTGEVLALVNYPSYNPNNRATLSYERVRNRVVTDVIEPGSVVKPFTMLAALEAGVVQDDSIIDTSPGYIVVDSKMLKDSRNNGPLSVSQILAKSSQVGITKIALAIDPVDIRATFEALGLGVSVGTGFPGEAVGRLPYYRSWRDIDRATMAFGHGVSMSLLQVVQAYQVIANGGVKVPLSLLKQNDSVEKIQVVAKHSADAVRLMLAGTVAKGGTAASSAINGYSLAGKTGTAHKLGKSGYISDKYRALFAGIAPAQEPRFVAVIMIDEPNSNRYYGGEVAAPVFAEVAASVLPYLGVLPEVKRESIARAGVL